MLYGRGEPVFVIFFLVLAIFFAGLLFNEVDESSSVYETMLASLSKKLPLSKYSFYSNPSRCRLIKPADLPTVSEALFNDFFKKNNVLLSNITGFKITSNTYNIVSSEDSLRIYTGKTPGLKGLPKQLINLSYIGFDSAKRQALVCVESQESGDIVYLQKSAGRWRVVKWNYVW